jgi:triacylglycerol lipase
MRLPLLLLPLLLASLASAQPLDLPRKEVPTDFSFAGLFDADPNYPFFEHAEKVPFEPAATGHSKPNAWWLAEMSMLSYGKLGAEGFVQKTLAKVGFASVPLGSDAKAGTQGFVAWNDAIVVVAFRGTEVAEKADVITDVRFCLTGEGEGEDGVHEGFRDALNQVWPIAIRQLRTKSSGRKVYFTGHSLGGALTTLAAERWRARGGAIQGVYTYGCPRVGDRRFATRYGTSNHHRYEHNNDIVTMVPLDRSLFAKGKPWLDRIGPLSYRHVGEHWLITHEGEVVADADFKARVASRWAGMKAAAHAALSDEKVDLRSVDHLKDHSPRYYVVATWNDLVKPLAPPIPEPVRPTPTFRERMRATWSRWYRAIQARRHKRGLIDPLSGKKE